MKNRLKFCLVIVLFVNSFMTFAQQTVISGKVTDQSGDLLPGVTIIIKGTTQGAVTDMDGHYTLSSVSPESVLIFSFVGMTTQEVMVGNQTTLNVTMIADAVGIDEVVAIGYGTQKRSSLTGAVAKLKNENLDKMPVGSAELAIIGQLPGLSIRQTSSRPGDSPQISIRGTSSITGNNDPLVVVDGFPTEGGLGSINSGDIESIEVLKDASSAAIYGSRAAGGVIIVTTKKGTNQKASFSFNAYYGAKKPAYLYDDILNSEETYQYSLRQLDVQWLQDGGDPNIQVLDRPVEYQPNEEKRDFADTDWQDEVLQTGIIQNYELSARGGNEMLNFYISGSYLNEESVFLVGDYKKYSMRANLSTKFNKRLQLATNIYASKTDQRRNTMRMREAIKYPSYIPVYFYDGVTAPDGSNYAWNRYYFNDNTSQVNPVAKALGEFNNYERFTAQANSYLRYSIIEGLDVKVSFGVRYNNTKNPYFRSTYAHKNAQTIADFDYSDNLNVLNENVLTYKKILNEVHAFDVLIGASYQKQSNFASSLEVIDGSIPDNRIQTLNVGTVSDGMTFESEWGLISYFGRLNYAFADKYLVSAAYRADGSSRFGADTKWGTFPSLSLGWRIDQEKFLSSISTIKTMKLRVSYGLTGRTTSGLYDPLARIQNFGYTLGAGNGTVVNGATQGTFGNSELGWEKTKEYNIGLDFGVFENRILLTADVYKRTTTDLLLDNPIPGITGFNSTTTNIGQLSNKGIELSLHTRNLTGQLKWDTKLNYSRNTNSVDDLGGLDQLPLSKASKGMWFLTKVGEPIGQFYGWHQQGVWKDQAEIDANPHYSGAQPGSIRIADLNNDGEIDTDDRAVLGNYMPDFEFGFINEFKYKNLDLSILINGVIGAEIYNFEVDYYRATRKIFTENQWFSPDQPGDGKTIGTTKGANLGSTDYYVQDGSYWGARNITLGYTFSNNSKVNKVFDSARLYLSVQNAFLVTSSEFTAYNPEGFTDDTGSLTTRGVNYGSEPLNRTFSMGVNLNF
jgi:TonB-linked SusC/RagA family outer membrane protein